ncbi:Oidioi.mRNA.OKI2018_I69.PAR.g11847.t1.cds [Oikopleura dioica]|uniref:Oidioi.mRNA.OKI2018_I69.PAR.g11847.t1.cds n=1 Tax=Oikopleura dioica TaxID=34765 RepID=A0ABN7S4D1_OIKDI|nr:Oidioi.mRNA.OKI2018_I69.PAR.g11847.t1.cds [Oikopleura dioica]
MKRRFGLSLEKDGPYAILVVASTAILSGFCFGFTGFQQVLTAQWKVHFQLPIQVASLHQRFSQEKLE